MRAHGLTPGFSEDGLPRPARLRTRRHHQDEVPGLFPDRRGFHPLRQDARHSGRAGARLGRWITRRLCADHHRSRSHPLRPSVRALSQSRTRLDAGFRHRFLPGSARRGDRLCAPPLWRGQGCADHHLWLVSGARRDAQRRARARNAARAGRPAGEAGAAESRRPGQPQTGDRKRAAPERGGRGRAARQKDAADRADARRALLQRLDACGGHRHRRPAAGRIGAALSRSANPTCRRPSST